MSALKKIMAILGIFALCVFSSACSEDLHQSDWNILSFMSSDKSGGEIESMFFDTNECSECEGTGKYCPYCEDGNCWKCGGEGKMLCWRCRGTDRCWSCNGTNYSQITGKSCSSCNNGKCTMEDCNGGYVDCDKCTNGVCNNCKAKRVCYMCDGEGFLEKPEDSYTRIEVVMENCSTCDGTGYYCSEDCNDGKCNNCDGSGRACYLCINTGDCHMCDGTGQMLYGSCTDCNGTGNCKRCGGANGSKCTHCGGTGLCDECYGTGICRSCSGRGKFLTEKFIEPKPQHSPRPNSDPSTDDFGVCENCGLFYENCKCYDLACTFCDGTRKISCYSCGGDGQCDNCAGTGKNPNYLYGEIKYSDCTYCVSGRCGTCHGTGEDYCPYC